MGKRRRLSRFRRRLRRPINIIYSKTRARKTVGISNDLKVVVGDERSLQGSRMRNAVPPPIKLEQESRTGRGVLMKEKL